MTQADAVLNKPIQINDTSTNITAPSPTQPIISTIYSDPKLPIRFQYPDNWLVQPRQNNSSISGVMTISSSEEHSRIFLNYSQINTNMTLEKYALANPWFQGNQALPPAGQEIINKPFDWAYFRKDAQCQPQHCQIYTWKEGAMVYLLILYAQTNAEDNTWSYLPIEQSVFQEIFDTFSPATPSAQLYPTRY